MHPRFLVSSVGSFALFFPALILAYLLNVWLAADVTWFVRLWLIVALGYAGINALRISGPGPR